MTSKILRKHRSNQLVAHFDDLVFLYPDGQAVRPVTSVSEFSALGSVSACHRIRFHDLRHTHGTLALQAGVPVHVVAERLGTLEPSDDPERIRPCLAWAAGGRCRKGRTGNLFTSNRNSVFVYVDPAKECVSRSLELVVFNDQLIAVLR